MAPAARPQPVKPSLEALLAERAAPWHVRRPLARAVAEAIAQHPVYRWPRYLEWLGLKMSDLPRERRKGKGSMVNRPPGKIVEETPEQTAAHERAHAAAAQPTPEQQELAERKAARARQAEAQRARWLEESGFGAVIEKAAALLEDLPRALEEHRRAMSVLPDLVDFVALAAEVPEDRTLARFARRAESLARTISTPPQLVENAASLRALIGRVRSADLEGVNGVRNSNLIAAWTRQFRELLTPLPDRTHAQWCAAEVKKLLAEARAEREGRR